MKKFWFLVALLIITGCRHRTEYTVRSQVLDQWQEHHPSWIQYIYGPKGQMQNMIIHPAWTEYHVQVVRPETLWVTTTPRAYEVARGGTLWTWRSK